MSPLACSSQESASNTALAKPSLPTSETSQEAVSSSVSLVDENIALKRRIAVLESAEERLTKRVAAAEQLAVAAKFETNAATARAQKRYTEMLHANNETRHLRLALDKEKEGRADYLVGSKSVFQGLRDEISRLNAEKAEGVWAKELTEQIDVLQDGFLAGEEDKKVLNKIISDLNNTISSLKGQKEASNKMLKEFKSLTSTLRQEIYAEKSKSKAASDALIKEQVEARITTTREEAIKEATTTAQGSFDAMKASMIENFETTVKTNGMQMKAQAQQYLKTQLDKWCLMNQTYKKNIAALQSKLSAASKQIELQGQRLAIVSGTVQHNHQRPAKHGQDISPEETFTPNKRRRLDSYGAAGITTPDFQHTHSASLSNTNAMSPGSAANTNGDAMIGRAHMQGQAQRTPNSIHRRQSSQHSNGSTGQITPTQRLSQQNGISSPQQSLSMMSPKQHHQQQIFQQQVASNNASRQSPTFGPYSPYLTHDSPQLQQQMGNSQQTTTQSGNQGLSKVQAFNGHPFQQMRRQVQSQAQAQTPMPIQQQMQFTHSYGPASVMPLPQPRATQVPSKRSMSFVAQPPSMSQEASRQYAPTIRDTETMTAFNRENPLMVDTYIGDTWFSIGSEPGKQASTPRTFIPTLSSNATPQMQEFDHEQPQQRGFQCHTIDPSQLQMDNPRDVSYGSNGAQNEPSMYMNDSRQPSVSGRETRASSRSTPAPAGRSRGQTVDPAEPAKVPCVNCYRHWWEHDCNEGEPCSNCAAEGVECVRQKCFNYAAGTCDKGNKCPNVHEGDERYHNEDFLVDQAKAGKRPQRLGKKTDAALAPITRQQV